MIFYGQIEKGVLKPEHDSDWEAFKKLKANHSYKFEVTSPRNYLFHKKFMALLNLAFNNQEKFDDFDTCRRWLVMKAGFVKITATPSIGGKAGGFMYEAKSISFAAMDETEFQDVYNKVMDVICLWLGAEKRDIIEQVVNFL